MKQIKVIYDNCKGVEGFQEGWGFSCLVDLGDRKILFDTGADAEAFFSNLEKFHVQCRDLTDLVYSHKHFDHVAGFEEVIMKLKSGSRIFLPKGFPSKRIPDQVKVEIVKDVAEISPNVYSLVLRGGFRLYEQALILTTKKGLVVITGCAHPGIVHLLEVVKTRLNRPIHMVLGGFHLFRSSQKEIEKIIGKFKEFQVQIAAPCHCTGKAAIERFQQAFQEKFYNIGSGVVITLEEDE